MPTGTRRPGSGVSNVHVVCTTPVKGISTEGDALGAPAPKGISAELLLILGELTCANALVENNVDNIINDDETPTRLQVTVETVRRYVGLSITLFRFD